MDAAHGSNIDPPGAVRVRLISGLSDGRSVVSRLDEAAPQVAARMDRETVVIRPTGRPTVAETPVYFGPRPEFRGTVVHDDGGGAILAGAIERPSLAAVVNIVGGLFAGFIAIVAATVLLSGDLSGIASLLFAGLGGLAVLASHLINRRLVSIDEQTIKAALRLISEGTSPSTGW